MTREEQIKKEAKNKYPYIKELPQTTSNQNIFIEGAKWADETMIEKACEWLSMNISDYIVEGSREGISLENQKQLINDFRKAMEE